MPHANRALRSFNMYLNVRKPPFTSPFSFFFPRQESAPAVFASSRRSMSIPIAPIPPASNPRGELIFSSRVDKTFRESYERYRAGFERKREERDRMEKGSGWFGHLFRRKSPNHVRSVSITATRTATPPIKTRSRDSSSNSSRSASKLRVE